MSRDLTGVYDILTAKIQGRVVEVCTRSRRAQKDVVAHLLVSKL